MVATQPGIIRFYRPAKNVCESDKKRVNKERNVKYIIITPKCNIPEFLPIKFEGEDGLLCSTVSNKDLVN
jgi:hypothetical protein